MDNQINNTEQKDNGNVNKEIYSIIILAIMFVLGIFAYNILSSTLTAIGIFDLILTYLACRYFIGIFNTLYEWIVEKM